MGRGVPGQGGAGKVLGERGNAVEGAGRGEAVYVCGIVCL